METVRLLEMLPEEEKNFAYEMVKRLVLAWDPDYTKVTPKEAKELAEAEQAAISQKKISTGTILKKCLTIDFQLK